MKPSLASAPTVITCHSNADWDALSSMIGMSMIYPDSIMIFPGSMEKPLNQFFNETAVFLYTFKNIKEIDHASVKRVVVVDTQIRSRVPQVQDLLDLPGVEVEVWDHHPTPYSGEKNKVINADVTHIGTTGSTCTLICQALQERGITPACQEATFLGLGIYGDTGAFTYTSTKPEDFLAGAWLRQHGMDLPFIADLVQTGMTSVHIKVLNELLDSATAHEIGPYSVVLAEATLDSFMGDFAYLAQKFMEMESCNVLFAPRQHGGKGTGRGPQPRGRRGRRPDLQGARGRGAPFRGVRFGQEHPHPRTQGRHLPTAVHAGKPEQAGAGSHVLARRRH